MRKRLPPKFAIGDWVFVKATLNFFYDEKNNRSIMRSAHTPPFMAQVTGARRKYLGTYNGGGAYGSLWDEEPDYEPPHLRVNGSVLVWLVKQGRFNKEFEVYEEDLELVERTAENMKAIAESIKRWKKVKHFAWTEKDKAELRNIMYDTPRDKSGRWVKTNALQK